MKSRWMSCSALVMAVSGLAGMALPTAIASTPAGAASKTSLAPITIGYIGDLTGVAASTFEDGPGGAQARVDYQNAHGGVNGHKIKLVVLDDQSNPTSFQTAAQALVQSKGALGII